MSKTKVGVPERGVPYAFGVGVSVERRLYCDAPDCERNVSSASPPPYIPGGFLEARQSGPNKDSVWHFCGWDCAMRFAAAKEPEEVIEA